MPSRAHFRSFEQESKGHKKNFCEMTKKKLVFCIGNLKRALEHRKVTRKHPKQHGKSPQITRLRHHWSAGITMQNLGSSPIQRQSPFREILSSKCRHKRVHQKTGMKKKYVLNKQVISIKLSGKQLLSSIVSILLLTVSGIMASMPMCAPFFVQQLPTTRIRNNQF